MMIIQIYIILTKFFSLQDEDQWIDVQDDNEEVNEEDWVTDDETDVSSDDNSTNDENNIKDEENVEQEKQKDTDIENKKEHELSEEGVKTNKSRLRTREKKRDNKLRRRKQKEERRAKAKVQKKEELTAEKKAQASLVSVERLLSDEDFKRIDMALVKKQIMPAKFGVKRPHPSDENRGELVKLGDIENIHKRRRHDKEARLETVKVRIV